MTDNERAMYTGVAICRNTEVTQRWARSQILLLIHSVMLSVILTRIPPTFLFLLGFSVGGLVLTVFWYLVNWRTNKWIVYWQSRLAAFEKSETNAGGTPVFTGPEWEKMTQSWFVFHRLVNYLIGLLAFVWVVVFIWAFSV